MDGHVRCMVSIAVWGRMCGNRELGGEPGSLLLYIIPVNPKNLARFKRNSAAGVTDD